MSLNEIRAKASKLQTKGRLAALLSIALGLILCVLFAGGFAREHSTLPRIAYAILIFFGLFNAVQAYRWVWPGRLAPDATYQACLGYYRRELEKKRDYTFHIFRRSGLVIAFTGLALLVIPPLIAHPEMWPKAAPVFVLLLIWIAIFIPSWRRKRRKLQQEFDELDALSRDVQ